jgi:hypothetical protein
MKLLQPRQVLAINKLFRIPFRPFERHSAVFGAKRKHFSSRLMCLKAKSFDLQSCEKGEKRPLDSIAWYGNGKWLRPEAQPFAVRH